MATCVLWASVDANTDNGNFLYHQQLAYEAWVAGYKAALRDHECQEQEEQIKVKRQLHRQEGTISELCLHGIFYLTSFF